MEPLKEMFNLAFYRSLTAEVKAVYPSLPEEAFFAACTGNLDTLELKERLRRTTEVCHQFLPSSFPEALELLMEIAPNVSGTLTAMFFPDFVGLYGREHFDLSMQALKFFTPFSSSEFAIREFLRDDLDRTLKVMYQWATDENHHVRRLSSEGCRPRLPWSFQLKTLVKDPRPVFPILETLKQDPELYVQKSVANHLNDISKDHPEKMLALVTPWDRSHPTTRWIVKQGARTLIKQGHPGALLLRGFDPHPQVEVSHFSVSPEQLKLGEPLHLKTTLHSTAERPQNLAIDYVLHYVKKSGATSEKVFKWKEIELGPGASAKFTKKQVIKDFTTRKHYPGFHKVELVINGNKSGESGFELGPK